MQVDHDWNRLFAVMIVPAAPLAVLAVAGGAAALVTPAEPPAPAGRLAGAVAPAGGMIAGFNFVPAPPHAAASPRSEAPSHHAQLALSARRVGAHATRAANREWRCITRLLGNHPSDRGML
jgi:hypothetical protein